MGVGNRWRTCIPRGVKSCILRQAFSEEGCKDCRASKAQGVLSQARRELPSGSWGNSETPANYQPSVQSLREPWRSFPSAFMDLC